MRRVLLDENLPRLTADTNLSFQQPLNAFLLGVVVLKARTTKLEDLLPLVPQILEALGRVEKGQVWPVSRLEV